MSQSTDAMAKVTTDKIHAENEKRQYTKKTDFAKALRELEKGKIVSSASLNLTIVERAGEYYKVQLDKVPFNFGPKEYRAKDWLSQ